MQNPPNHIYSVLAAGQNLILEPEHWTQGAFARTGGNTLDHIAVEAEDIDATCWCSMGAMLRVTVDQNDLYDRAIELLKQAMGGEVDQFNDTHEHDEVLAAWDRAKELALQ